nr:PREDICTED: uncharacterized protein LOC102360285 [Latimeria chalumnae]|eukprot:XP_014354447.1 PREDICTED: uncharacterized protein LOC102360285 [Latimeria chalumnae]
MENEMNEFEGIEVLEWSSFTSALEKSLEKPESVEKEEAGTKQMNIDAEEMEYKKVKDNPAVASDTVFASKGGEEDKELLQKDTREPPAALQSASDVCDINKIITTPTREVGLDGNPVVKQALEVKPGKGKVTGTVKDISIIEKNAGETAVTALQSASSASNAEDWVKVRKIELGGCAYLLRQEYCSEELTWSLIANMCKGVAMNERFYFYDPFTSSSSQPFFNLGTCVIDEYHKVPDCLASNHLVSVFGCFISPSDMLTPRLDDYLKIIVCNSYMLEELKNSLKPLQDTHQKIAELKEKYRGNLLNIHDEADKTEKQIKEDFVKLHQFLHEEETNLLADLKQEEEEKAQKMRAMEESIVQDLTSVSKIIKDIQQKMDEEDQIFLMTLQDIRESSHFFTLDPKIQ